MKVIKRILRKNIIVIDEDEMDLIDWDKVKHGCIYLDIWGNVHLEINNKGYLPKPYNSNLWKIFVRQDLMYAELPMKLLKACKSKPVSDLIGARQFIYLRSIRTLLPSNVGILSWEYIKSRGYEKKNPYVGDVRRYAFERLFGILDVVAIYLGAKTGYFPTATIPAEKMEKYDCHLTEITTWKQRLFKSIITFPMRGVKVYLKKY